MKYFAFTCSFLLLFAMVASNAAFAQNHEESIEESWNKATKESAAQKPPVKAMESDASREAYKWQKGENKEEGTVQETQTMQPNAWPYLPENATAADFYRVNNSLIDSLTNMYCVSAAYIRTLRNRNESAKVQAPPPAQMEKPKKDGDKFDYEKESWQQEKQAKPEQTPPPASDTKESELRVLNQELIQLYNKCLNH